MKITFLKQHGQLVPYSAKDKENANLKARIAELEKKEIDTVYDVLNALTAEKFGISILFPSKNGNA